MIYEERKRRNPLTITTCAVLAAILLVLLWQVRP